MKKNYLFEKLKKKKKPKNFFKFLAAMMLRIQVTYIHIASC